MPSCIINDLYFFDQRSSFKVKLPRSRKRPEDVFGRSGALNPDLAAYLNSIACDEDESPTTVDLPRQIFNRACESATDLLTRLSLYLYQYGRMGDRRAVVPWTLRRQLNADWTELTSDVQYVKREWQSNPRKRRSSCDSPPPVDGTENNATDGCFVPSVSFTERTRHVSMSKMSHAGSRKHSAVDAGCYGGGRRSSALSEPREKRKSSAASSVGSQLPEQHHRPWTSRSAGNFEILYV